MICRLEILNFFNSFRLCFHPPDKIKKLLLPLPQWKKIASASTQIFFKIRFHFRFRFHFFSKSLPLPLPLNFQKSLLLPLPPKKCRFRRFRFRFQNTDINLCDIWTIGLYSMGQAGVDSLIPTLPFLQWPLASSGHGSLGGGTSQPQSSFWIDSKQLGFAGTVKGAQSRAQEGVQSPHSPSCTLRRKNIHLVQESTFCLIMVRSTFYPNLIS